MNQSELADKVAQKTTLTQAAATGAVKAVVQAILESLVAGEPVRVPASEPSMWRHGLRATGGIHKRGRVLKFRPARQCGSTQGRPLKMPSTPILQHRPCELVAFFLLPFLFALSHGACSPNRLNCAVGQGASHANFTFWQE